MKITVDFKVNWRLLGVIVASMIVGAGLAAFLLFDQPTICNFEIELPNAYVLPS